MSQQEADIIQTTKALSAFEQVTEDVAAEVSKLINKTISAAECKQNVIKHIQKHANGKISEENAKFISEHVDKINSAFIEKTTKDKAKEAFYSFIAITGKAIALVGAAFVVLGAAQASAETVSDVLRWCRSNLFDNVKKIDDANKSNVTRAIADTAGVVSQSVGVLSTVMGVLGVVVSVGVLTHALGKKMQEYKPDTKHSGLWKMSEADKEALRENLIKEMAAKMPEEVIRHKREAKLKVTSLSEKQKSLISKGISNALERLRAKKAGIVKQEGPEDKKHKFVEMVRKSQARLAGFEKETEGKEDDSERNWVKKEHERSRLKKRQKLYRGS
jgi:molybdopterin/thiamine biosynthesis adenylyltransferase